MDQPRYHTTEDGRWDYRVTIVFKNATVANEPFDEDTLKKQLFPDQEVYQHEEQRRFTILEAHWDLPVKPVDLDANNSLPFPWLAHICHAGRSRGARVPPDMPPVRRDSQATYLGNPLPTVPQQVSKLIELGGKLPGGSLCGLS